MYNPTVIDNNGKSERAYDIYSRLLKDRIIFVGTAIDENVANSIIAQLLYLESEDPEKDIIMYINSPGGSVTDGMAIYDTMNYIKPDVQTVCVGQAASMGAFLLSSGAKGKRFALENSRIMIHQPLISGGLKGQATDISIHANELLKIKDRLAELLARNTGKTKEQILNDTERDNYQAILVGAKTVLIDNPKLTGANTSLFPPKRIVLDAEGSIFEHSNLNLFNNSSSEVIVFTKVKHENLPSHVTLITPNDFSIKEILSEIAKLGIQSVYVEGGPNIHDQFLASGYWDEVITYISPILLGGNNTSSFTSSRITNEKINFRKDIRYAI